MMSEQPETLSPVFSAASEVSETLPQAKTSQYGTFEPMGTRFGVSPQPASPAFNVKPYVLGALFALMVAVVGYQQMEISRLSSEIGSVSTGSQGLRGRLDATDTKLQELNTRLTYLDSKINATDQKAQMALDKLKAQENSGNILGNWLNEIGKSLGLNR